MRMPGSSGGSIWARHADGAADRSRLIWGSSQASSCYRSLRGLIELSVGWVNFAVRVNIVHDSSMCRNLRRCSATALCRAAPLRSAINPRSL
jgi:hypothetical protein